MQNERLSASEDAEEGGEGVVGLWETSLTGLGIRGMVGVEEETGGRVLKPFFLGFFDVNSFVCTISQITDIRFCKRESICEN